MAYHGSGVHPRRIPGLALACAGPGSDSRLQPLPQPPIPPAAVTSLRLLGRIARIRNGGGDADVALSSVADAIRSGLGATVVTIWVRSPGSRTFYAIASPAEAGSA